MSNVRNVILTVNVDKALDAAIQKTMRVLGYNSKAELTREALREFVIRRKVYTLFGGELVSQDASDMTAVEVLEQIQGLLRGIPEEHMDKEIPPCNKARDQHPDQGDQHRLHERQPARNDGCK